MAKPQESERLAEVYEELSSKFEDDTDKADQLDDLADATCTLGFNNDGSTGFEIFENGYDLAVKAAGRPVFYFRNGDDDDGAAMFFIGTEDEVEAKMRAV
ncbi:MAG: hypothetical protein ACRD6W_11615 [Nitrososphaerales archaeon]